MTSLRIFVKGEKAGPQLERIAKKQATQVRAAVRSTAQTAAELIEALGSLDIAKAPGKWGPRWTTGLHAKVTESKGELRVQVTHDVSYFIVFEEGRIIRGKPLLWIPLSFALDAQGVMARDYPGRLFRVNRPGKAPLLLATAQTARVGRGKAKRGFRTGSVAAEPKYFGKESVKIPQKFHIREIARNVAKQMPKIYNEALRGGLGVPAQR